MMLIQTTKNIPYIYFFHDIEHSIFAEFSRLNYYVYIYIELSENRVLNIASVEQKQLKLHLLPHLPEDHRRHRCM